MAVSRILSSSKEGYDEVQSSVVKAPPKARPDADGLSFLSVFGHASHINVNLSPAAGNVITDKECDFPEDVEKACRHMDI